MRKKGRPHLKPYPRNRFRGLSIRIRQATGCRLCRPPVYHLNPRLQSATDIGGQGLRSQGFREKCLHLLWEPLQKFRPIPGLVTYQIKLSAWVRIKRLSLECVHPSSNISIGQMTPQARSCIKNWSIAAFLGLHIADNAKVSPMSVSIGKDAVAHQHPIQLITCPGNPKGFRHLTIMAILRDLITAFPQIHHVPSRNEFLLF